jgi:hypothetical protein
MVSNEYFASWSLSNIAFGSSAPILLNKRTREACRQPHGIHTALVLRVDFVSNLHPVRLAYQPPASSTFLSEQTSHQQPANSTFISEQTSTSHQPPANRTGC